MRSRLVWQCSAALFLLILLTSVMTYRLATHGFGRSSLLIACGLAMLAGFVLVRRLTAPIRAMAPVAEAMSRGEYGRSIRALPANEIGILAAALNRLAATTARTITTLSADRAPFETVIRSMTEGVIAIDAHDTILICNAAAAALLDIPEGEPRGRALIDVVRLPEIHELVQRIHHDRGSVDQELMLVRQNREAIVHIHAAAFQGGTLQGAVLVLHDVSELRRLERVRRDFVANVSHEFKTPLTVIHGYVETLLDGDMDDRAQSASFLRKIDAQVRRLTQMVRDLLELARIESQRQFVATAPVVWHDLLAEVEARWRGRAEAGGLQWQAETSSAPIAVRGDATAMTQIMDNLIDNAIKYTPAPGWIRLRVWSEPPYGVVEVGDSGVGIPEAEHERIFERFYRSDRSRARAIEGTGLGLAIVKHLVLAMHGTVAVQSQEGQGSVFRVSLPLV